MLFGFVVPSHSLYIVTEQLFIGYTPPYTHTCIHTHTHIYIHTHTHTHTYTHIHTQYYYMNNY